MMKKKHCVVVPFLAFFMFLAASAITVQAAQTKGANTLQLGGSFFHAQGADVGTLNLDLGYGHFLYHNWEVGLIQTLGYSFIDDGKNQWVASTIPYVNYHIRGLSQHDTFQPFIGAFIGASYNKDDVTGTLGPQIGFRSFVNNSTFITVKYRYEWFFDELTFDDIDDAKSDGNHVVTLGVGFVF